MKKVSSTMGTPLLLHTLLDRGPLLQPDNVVIEKCTTGFHSTSYAEHMYYAKVRVVLCWRGDAFLSPSFVWVGPIAAVSASSFP